MKWIEFKEQLRQNINGISIPQKLQFAIKICDRLLPDYESFSELNNWGNIKPLVNGLNYCKEFVVKFEFEPDSLRKLILEIEKNTPDSEDFGTDHCSLAMNAGCVINETLHFILDKNNNRILDIGILAYDTALFKLAEKKPNLKVLKLENEMEMHKEIEWQLKETKNVA